MNTNTVKLFHELMKKGRIDRNDNAALWIAAEDEEVRDELDFMGSELGFEIVNAPNRIYLVPTENNDLFLKNNIDYRADIKAGNDARVRDLYLLNYLAVFVLFIFFKGEGNDIRVRDFITKEDLIKEFTEHTENVAKKGIDGEEKKDDYSENFVTLANDWLSKKEGTVLSRKTDERYGVINKLLLKFRADDLFTEESGIIKPTKKTCDLMPYVLRKDRVQTINDWIGETCDAADK